MSGGAFVIIAPNSMAFRAIVNSDTLPLLKKEIKGKGYDKFFVLSPDNGSQESLPDYVEWRDFRSPSLTKQTLPVLKRITRAIRLRAELLLGMGFGNLVYRFNEIQGFFAHNFKKTMSQQRRDREELAGNFVSQKYGFPFAKSNFLYKLIFSSYYSKWQITDPNISHFFDETNIKKIIFWHVQDPIYREYSVVAKKHKTPYIAVLGSWDRPTTKGPICPGSESYIVNSKVMEGELQRYHGIKSDKIHVVGWPQMDIYHDQSFHTDRKSFLKSIGIDAKKKTLVYTGNAARLGAHEPSLVEHLSKQIHSGIYGEDIHLVIRPHPQDVDWETRYSNVNAESKFANCVTLMPSEMGNIKTMVNTLSHADIVIATQGSISLDAAALDKKIINIAFDGNLTKTYTESVKRWYEMDHYVPVVDSGGVAIVCSFESLDTCVAELLDSDPQKEGREVLRQLELEPFKGDSSARQVKAMLL